MKKTIGILAHVDAGKTTLSEQLLFLANATRRLGRVDHQDSFLDHHPLERSRGITIFSGQAHFELNGDEIWWLDTPGHVDFSAEMERALAVMDYAVLVISCAEGVQAHTETVWELLRAYGVPVFIFINKTDREGADQERVIAQIRKRLGANIADLRGMQATGSMDDALYEAVAAEDEALLERFLMDERDEQLWTISLRRLIRERKLFPVMSGAALNGVGVEGFARLLTLLTETDYEARAAEPFSAKVWQVRHTADGQRLCFLHLMSGSLRVKDTVQIRGEAVQVNELRIFHGEKSRPADIVTAGDMAAIPGLEGLLPGDVIGAEGHRSTRLEPMMASELLWDEKQVPAFRMMQALRQLEEEDPTLSVTVDEGRVSIRTMGRIQQEVLQQILQERYGFAVSFGPAHVLYRETIRTSVIGIGHYEPLKHYAEAHLRLVPTEEGTGITFRSCCHVDTLALNWQRLIETHVFEKEHHGVLIGAPITDIRFELTTGRAHLKHTEGGDFRQAVYRAIRHGLMQAESVLLEPICGFSMRFPAESWGRMTGALMRLKAETAAPETDGEDMLVTGEAPYALMMAWQPDFLSLTHGRGSLRLWTARYAPCHNAAEVIAQADYNPLAHETPDSVFCSHGAGYTVPWEEVKAHAHMVDEE